MSSDGERLLSTPSRAAQGVEDLSPTPANQRSWGWATFAAVWTAMVINPAAISEGAALLSLGLSVAEAAIAHALGGVVLVCALALNAWPGVQHGIPFPVLARSAFGRHGAQLCTLSRGAVAILWLSFQLWQGALGIFAALCRAAPGLREWRRFDETLTLGQLLVLLGFAALHALAIACGVARFRRLAFAVAPLQLLGCVGLACWAASLAPPAEALAAASRVGAAAAAAAGGLPRGSAWLVALNSSVSTWSTLVLNVCDLARFGRSQRQQVLGQAAGLPLPYALTGLLGIWLGGATYLAAGTALWQVPAYFELWPAGAAAAGGLVLGCAVLVVNVLANVLSPANDLLNVPCVGRRCSFRACAMACIGLALLTQPWRTFASEEAFVRVFLNGYGLVTGAIAGVLLVDFWSIGRGTLDVASLYDDRLRAFNWRAFAAVGAGAAPCLPGFVAASRGGDAAAVGPLLALLYHGSWFASLSLSAACFWLVSPARPKHRGGGGGGGGSSATSDAGASSPPSPPEDAAMIGLEEREARTRSRTLHALQ